MSPLIDTLRDALSECYNRRDHGEGDRYSEALSLLSTPDALAWALLEEMAERVVGVEITGAGVTNFIVDNVCYLEWYSWPEPHYELPGIPGDIPDEVVFRGEILARARAIKEQEGREQDA